MDWYSEELLFALIFLLLALLSYVSIKGAPAVKGDPYLIKVSFIIFSVFFGVISIYLFFKASVIIAIIILVGIVVGGIARELDL